MRVDTTRVMFVYGSLPPIGAAGEMPEFGIEPPLGAPLQIFVEVISRNCFHMGIPQQDSRGLKSKFFLS